MIELQIPRKLQEIEEPSLLPRNVPPLILRLFTIPKVLLEVHQEGLRLPRAFVAEGGNRMLVAKNSRLNHEGEGERASVTAKCPCPLFKCSGRGPQKFPH